MDYSIGEIARWVGYAVQTVRYYEQMGLLPKPWRTGRGQRRYGEDSLKRLRFIRHARQLGFPLDDIRSLLEIASAPARSRPSLDASAGAHVAAIDAKIASLNALRGELDRLLKCSADGAAWECRILDLVEAEEDPSAPGVADPTT